MGNQKRKSKKNEKGILSTKQDAELGTQKIKPSKKRKKDNFVLEGIKWKNGTIKKVIEMGFKKEYSPRNNTSRMGREKGEDKNCRGY